jgi:hypothetical protein
VIPLAIRFDASPRAEEDQTSASRWRALPLRIGGWVRDLVSSEPPEARRRRLESEAAAELDLPDQVREQIK